MTTRPLLAIERSHLALHPSRATDPTYVALMVAQSDAASAYDSASDGALHHAYSADTAERMYHAAKRTYDVASAAFITYAKGLAR